MTIRTHQMRILALTIAAASLTACYGPVESDAASTNKEYKVERLFKSEGCAIYRFYDAGRARYFSKCENAVSATSWQESCGKNCTQESGVTQ